MTPADLDALPLGTVRFWFLTPFTRTRHGWAAHDGLVFTSHGILHIYGQPQGEGL